MGMNICNFMRARGKCRPIQVVARSKASVCGRPLAGIAGSNPAGGIDVCLLHMCVVRQRTLRWADHTFRGVLPCVMCLCDVETSTMRRPRPW